VLCDDSGQKCDGYQNDLAIAELSHDTLDGMCPTAHEGDSYTRSQLRPPNVAGVPHTAEMQAPAVLNYEVQPCGLAVRSAP